MAGNGYYGEFSTNCYGPKDTIDVFLDLDNKELQIRKVVEENDKLPFGVIEAHDGVPLILLVVIELKIKATPVYPCVNTYIGGDRVEFYRYKRHYD